MIASSSLLDFRVGGALVTFSGTLFLIGTAAVLGFVFIVAVFVFADVADGARHGTTPVVNCAGGLGIEGGTELLGFIRLTCCCVLLLAPLVLVPDKFAISLKGLFLGGAILTGAVLTFTADSTFST